MNGMNRHTGKPLSGLDHIRQSIADILATPIGSRVCRRDYGSRLPELLDHPTNDATRLRLYAATAIAISRQESRVRLSRVGLSATETPGAFVLDLTGTTTDAARRRSPFAFSIPVRALGALAA
ncbi:GPW/gp25 family protein [Sphingomonas sp. LT1P40]|uniref:GPW/gp25 family protein n=1 Tax=Alteristakelama amylovorans TaxID=3096166 RepID=UPI002FC6D3B3